MKEYKHEQKKEIEKQLNEVSKLGRIKRINFNPFIYIGLMLQYHFSSR